MVRRGVMIRDWRAKAKGLGYIGCRAFVRTGLVSAKGVGEVLHSCVW